MADEGKPDGGRDAVQRDDPAPLSKLRVEQIVDDGDGTPQPVVPLHGDLVERNFARRAVVRGLVPPPAAHANGRALHLRLEGPCGLRIVKFHHLINLPKGGGEVRC